MKRMLMVTSMVVSAVSAWPVEPAERSDAHAWLLKLAGEYTTENSYSPAPGAPPRRSLGTATLAPMLEGGFLREESASEAGPGRVQRSLKIWGYDEASRRFQAAWTYTGSTAILLLTGEAAHDESVVSYEGEYLEPGTGRHTLRVELRPIGADRFSLSLRSYGEDGKERATLVTTYSRSR